MQLREKTLMRLLLRKATELELCHHYNVPLIINDNGTCKKIHVDGVHIGQSDMEIKKCKRFLGADKIIGVTAKTIEQAKAAETAGADYLEAEPFLEQDESRCKTDGIRFISGNLRECNYSGCCDRRDQRRQCPSAERQKDGGSSSCQRHFRM